MQPHPDVLRAGNELIPNQMYRFSTDNGPQTARFVNSDNENLYFRDANNQNNRVSAYPKTIIASTQPRLRLPGMDPPFVAIGGSNTRKTRKHNRKPLKRKRKSNKRH
jgi:hypothetical protein